MQANLFLDDLTERVLRELGKLGLNSETRGVYRCACENLKAFAATRGTDRISKSLIEGYLQNVEKDFRGGTVSAYRRGFLRRASLLLKDYATNGAISGKCYRFKQQPMPRSPEFQMALSSFVEYLRACGKSDSTIQVSKCLVRQFLLFLQDCGCGTLSAAVPVMVPEFFQHLLATYLPTSVGTVASKIRTFLRFADGGARLLPAVPSRCVRAKSIIPILSDQELEALKDVLNTSAIPLRDRAIILLALRTGLRAVDIVGMRLSDIDWVCDTISIVQSKTKTALTIPLSADVGNALSAYIFTGRPKTDIPQVFLSLGAPILPLGGHAACYAVVRRAFHLAGIRLGNERKGIHVIRHTVASRMLANGVPVTAISSLLGHANISSTEVYLQTDEARMKACALSLAGIPWSCGGLA